MYDDWAMWDKGGSWQENDEGYHYKHCSACRRRTEHDLDDCLRCSSLMIRKAKRSADWCKDVKENIDKQD